jgi:hypothetical protein
MLKTACASNALKKLDNKWKWIQCLFVHLFVSPFTSLPVCVGLSIRPYHFYPFVHLSVSPFIHLSICPFVGLSICQYYLFHLSRYFSVSPLVYLLVCPIIGLSICPFVVGLSFVHLSVCWFVDWPFLLSNLCLGHVSLRWIDRLNNLAWYWMPENRLKTGFRAQ